MTFRQIGEVSVESGMIVILDPAYASNIDYDAVVVSLDHYRAEFLGVVTPTAYGDGTYPIYHTFQGESLVGIFVDLSPDRHTPKRIQRRTE